jgi:hypothetical protein
VLRGINSGSVGHRKEFSVTSLRQRVLDELQRRNYSSETTRGYVHAIKQFAEYFHKSPEQLGGDEIRQFELSTTGNFLGTFGKIRSSRCQGPMHVVERLTARQILTARGRSPENVPVRPRAKKP